MAEPGRIPAAPIGALGAILRRGVATSAIALVAVQVVTLGQTLVLARLLSPVEVGLFAAGTVLATFLAVFAEGALTQALIQREGDVEDAANTVFWVTIGIGALMSVLAFAAAPLIGVLFGDPTAGLIAAATAGTMLLHAFTNVPDALMQRRFEFRRRLVVDPATSVTFAAVSITLAALGHGVWALVIGSYASLVVWIVASWGLARWRPGRGRPSVRLWREMAGFAFPLLLGTVVERGREILELVVVGRWLDAASLGHYRYGKRIALIPGSLVIQAGAYVLFPAFSRIAGDPVRLKAAFLRALTWVWLVTVPVAGLLVACGEPLAVLLLGERWRGAGVALTAMAGVGVGQALSAVTTEAMKGAGRSHRINWVTGAGVVSGVGLLLALVHLGLVGVGLAISGSAIVMGLTGLWFVRDVVAVSTAELARRLLLPVLAAAVAVTAVGLTERLVVRADTRPTIVGLGLLAAEAVVFGAIYLATLSAVSPTLGRELLAVVRRGLRR